MLTGIRTLALMIAVVFAFGVSAESAAASHGFPSGFSKERILRNLKVALNTAAKMDDDVHKDNSLKNISIGYAQLKEYGSAIEVTDLIKRDYIKADALVWIARQSGSASQENKALTVLDRALAVTDEIRDPFRHSESLLNIANTYVTLDREQFAPGILAQALGIAHQLKPTRQKAELFKSIGLAYLTAGMNDQSEGILAQARKIGRQLYD